MDPKSIDKDSQHVEAMTTPWKILITTIAYILIYLIDFKLKICSTYIEVNNYTHVSKIISINFSQNEEIYIKYHKNYVIIQFYYNFFFFLLYKIINNFKFYRHFFYFQVNVFW